MKKKRNKNLIYIIIAVMIIIFFFLPIKISNKVKSNGKIFPVKEWIITKGQDGRLMTSLIDNKLGVSQSYTLNIFERGDAVKFNFNPDLFTESEIVAGDTIASIYSNELEIDLSELKGNLLTDSVALSVTTSGEKESIIEAEKNRVAYAKEAVLAQSRIYERKKVLYEKNIIAKEEYEIAESTLDLFKTNVEIAEATLQAVRTGQKEEEINYIRARIIALRDKIKILESRVGAYNFVSPISGNITRSFSSDTLLIIHNKNELVLFIPILIDEAELISNCQEVEIHIPAQNETVTASIFALNNSVQIVGSNQVRIATAVIEEYSDKLLPGLIVKCTLHCGEITPLEYAVNFLNQIFTY